MLDWYAEPYDACCPPIGFDESPVQLSSEKRRPLPVRPGQPECYDYAYQREGTANLFLFVQPLQGWRHVNVTAQRTPQDVAQQMRLLVDVYFPAADRIRLVVDTLNTHTPAALYQAFTPAEARRIIRQLEFHYTPKQGRWLPRAECEFAVLAAQGWDRRIPDSDTLRREIAAWQTRRNQHQAKIHWQFGTDLARVRLKRLYPSVEPPDAALGQEATPMKTDLAQYAVGDVAWALAGQTDIQAVLPALLGDQFEGIEPGRVVFGAAVSTQKIVRLVDHDHRRPLLERAGAGLDKEMTADDIGDDLARVILVGDTAQTDAQQPVFPCLCLIV